MPPQGAGLGRPETSTGWGRRPVTPLHTRTHRRAENGREHLETTAAAPELPVAVRAPGVGEAAGGPSVFAVSSGLPFLAGRGSR